jgi:general secretion pathway protein F
MDYDYLSIDSTGKEFRGTVSAPDLDDARHKLRGMGLTIVELKAKRLAAQKKFSFGKKGITDSDLYSLFKEFKVLAAAGINIDRALALLAKSTAKPVLKEALEDILRDIKGGKTLAKAFEDTGHFNSLVVVMLKVGEGIGDFKSSFDNISAYIGFQMGFKNEIRNAMAYPLFLVFASLIVLVVIFKLIIPRFFSIFGQNTANLPFVAKWLYGISQLLSGWSLVVVAGCIAALVIFSKHLHFDALKDKAFDYLFRVPLLRNLILNLELSRFSYAMHTMLKSGVEFINALKLSKDVVQNRFMSSEIERTIPQIKEGKGIAEAFSHVSFIPPMMYSMLTVGEASGNLKDIFFELHEVADEKFKNSMKRVLVLVEPIIIVLMGIVVGFIVISLILTVMNVGNIKL